MLLFGSCPVCFWKSKDLMSKIKLYEVSESGIYENICESGHETFKVFRQDKCEILFDMSLVAFLDGYNREAVLNLAGATERFYEFCIKVFLKKKKIQVQEFEKTWKLVKNMSERQVGAFYFLYLDITKKSVPKNSEEKVAFRNKVVHKGYIPTRSETEEYGEWVLKHIYTLWQEILISCSDEVSMVKEEDMERRINEIRKDNSEALISNGDVLTSLNLEHCEITGKETFLEKLEMYKSLKANFEKMKRNERCY